MADRDRPATADAPDTPMFAQYRALKAESPDCLLFFRMGDFFELFFTDAGIAAACLDIALTSRGDGAAMCGVPVHAADAYLARLIRAGHRVAIADQVETPAEARRRAGAKALVERRIVRIVTAGTLTEETLLDARASNWLAAVCVAGGLAGIAAADISTGRLELTEVPRENLAAELARIAPAETIAPEGLDAAPAGAIPCPPRAFDAGAAERGLKARFGVATLDGYGRFGRVALAACGGLLAYLDRSARGAALLLQPPTTRDAGDHMLIDAATRESLELVRTRAGERRGSLLACVDRTVTGAGARLLAADLSAPLGTASPIEARLAMVAWLEGDAALREEVRATLKALPDIGRALGRLVAGRGSPRDLGMLRDGLAGARLLRERIGRLVAIPSLAASLLPPLDGHGALVELLARALVPAPPIDASAGGYIAQGHDAALDELRATAGDGRRAIAALEARYRERTGIARLKIRHNAVLGYHIEVPQKDADPLMRAESGFTHRQTLAGVVRFNAADLHEQAQRVAQAGAHALAAEAAHLEELCAAAAARGIAIAATAEALARFDVAAGLAERAAEGGWSRPAIVAHPCLEIAGGRHPVVEAAVAAGGARFVANDCRLSRANRLWLIGGPNMGGKSTFLRQNAVIAVLAQAGSFVPASSATLGLVDRLFSRVGAADDLAKGRSTFMVEMIETAAILTQATDRSLVVLDEIGRGTSTYDGLAIAWGVVEAIHALGVRCLFATHYHELARLASRLEALSLHHVRAREYKGDLILLHEVADGPADRSYGIAVARLAGVPAAVLARAKEVLARLEKGRERTGGIAAGLDDLPLFAALAEPPPPDPLRNMLHAVDADALSPRDALELVYRLKTLIG